MISSENFTYWLQGFFELSNADSLTKEQVATIKLHLAMVFDQTIKNNIISSNNIVSPQEIVSNQNSYGFPTNVIISNITKNGKCTSC
jgi:hypothetical protein